MPELGFLTILCAVIMAVVAGVYVASRRAGAPAIGRTLGVGIGMMLWLAMTGAIVESGALSSQPMPRLLLFMVAVNVVSIGFALSPVGGWLASGLPLGGIVAFQGFRLPLELILHEWARVGFIPWTMSWNGRNYDVVSGVLALAIAPLAGRSRAACWVFNGVGAALLLNVIRVAVLSSPLPFGWGVQPPLTLALQLPYAWILPVCVGGALAGHVVLTRALLLKRGPT